MRRQVLVVDGANVVGSRPDGWWKDRAGAARRLHGQLATADTSYDEIVLVLEGQARGGVPAGRDGHLRTMHAPRDGDAAIVAAAVDLIDGGGEVDEVGEGSGGIEVVVVTADRALQQRVEYAGARTMSPTWLLGLLSE